MGISRDITQRRHVEEKLIKAYAEVEGKVEARTTELSVANKNLAAKVTELKQQKKHLGRKKLFGKTLMDTIPIPVFYKDRDGKYLGLNTAFETFIGATKERLIGKSVFDIHPPELAEKYNSKDNELFNSGGVQTYETQWQIKDGSLRDIIFNKGVFIDNKGNAGGLIGTIFDITESKQTQEALKKTQKFLEAAIGHSPAGILIADPPDVTIRMANHAALGIRGGSLGLLTGIDVTRHSANWQTFRSDGTPYPSEQLPLSRAVLKGEVTQDEELIILNEDGDSRWVSTNAAPIRGSEGEIISGIVVFHDITERKQSEVALRESEDKFRGFAEQSLVGIYLISDGVFKYVNPKFAEIFGYSVDECLNNMHFRKLVHPEDLDTVQKQVSRRLSEETKSVRYSFRGIKKNGEPIHVEVFGSSMVSKGKTFATGTMLDITESKRAQEALRESEEKYRTILEDIEDGYFEVDIAGNLTLFNGSLCEILGYSKDELTGMNNRQFTDEENAKKLYQTFNRVYTTGKSDKGFDWKIMRKDGNRRFVETSISPKKGSEGQTIGFQGIVRDVSDRREIEKDRAKLEARLQRAQKMEAIGTLAGGVAHDLNNILGGLVSYPELLLLQLPLNSPLRKSILTIQKSGEKAAAVVQDLLTLARRGVVITEVVNLNHVVSEYLKSLEHEKLQSFHPTVRIETLIEKDTLNILGSSTHLSKTVMNLVSNAAEAMPEGGKICISTENRYVDRPIGGYDDIKEGDYVVLTISDTGTGISPEDMDKIFEPFYTKKKMGRSGTGLGMAVVWGTVKDHNGYIHAQSTEGKGTTFTLFFPVTRKSLEERSETFMEDYMGKGETILVVDDVEEQRNIASVMLKALGYSVVSVSSGEEAVEYMKISKVDLLILDMIMDPGMDGLDTYRKILEMHSEQKAIIASGFSETNRAKKLQHLGAGAYIRKPFLLEKIGIAVKEELEK